MKKRIYSVLVENRAGVLGKVVGLFSRRCFNIDSLVVGETEDPSVSRMTIVSSGDELIHYYATVLPNSNEHLDDYLAFVNFFHENSMSKDTADELSTYLEPKSTVNNGFQPLYNG